ncbi:MAG: flagellar basal body rod C-terminal domain-containing protein [Thermodesulfobacteriota bacterium]
MISPIGSAPFAALQSAQKKMDSVANNVANADSDGYKKTRVTLAEGQGGTVQAQVERVETPGPLLLEQTAAGAELVEKSNVDLGEELPEMLLTRRFFQANVKVLRTGDEMLGTLLDVKG